MINVRVKAGSKGEEGVMQMKDGSLVVRVHARAHDGEANKAVVELVAKYLGVTKSRVEIVRGMKSREKVVRVQD